MFPSIAALALAEVMSAAVPMPLVVRPPLPIQIGDELAGRRLAYLATRSATMKQILAVLKMTPAISVRLRSNQMLWRQSRRKGVGRFWRAGAQVVVLLQFDSVIARPLEQIESVAHEMAHAVEVACLPHLIEIDQLRGQLLRRGRPVSGAPRLAIETPFAGDAGRQIVMEALRGRPGTGRLPELAEKHKLGVPCAESARKNSEP
jgi:hypothetical protein